MRSTNDYWSRLSFHCCFFCHFCGFFCCTTVTVNFIYGLYVLHLLFFNCRCKWRQTLSRRLFTLWKHHSFTTDFITFSNSTISHKGFFEPLSIGSAIYWHISKTFWFWAHITGFLCFCGPHHHSKGPMTLFCKVYSPLIQVEPCVDWAHWGRLPKN